MTGGCLILGIASRALDLRAFDRGAKWGGWAVALAAPLTLEEWMRESGQTRTASNNQAILGFGLVTSVANPLLCVIWIGGPWYLVARYIEPLSPYVIHGLGAISWGLPVGTGLTGLKCAFLPRRSRAESF